MADKVSTIFSSSNPSYYTSVPNSVRPPKTKAQKIGALVVLILGVALSSYFGYLLVSRKSQGGLKPYLYADVYYGKAKVSVDNTPAGDAPLENYVVTKGNHKIKLESDGVAYETNLAFYPGSPGMVKRDIGIDQVFSGGFDLWHEKNSGGAVLSLISEPSDAKVFIDGTEKGKTPYTTDKLTDGAYEVRLEKEGYEPISERINILKDKKVNVSFKLFPLPTPFSVKLMEGSENVYDIISGNSFVTASPQKWAKALIYWNKTRGINIMGLGTNRDLVFKYILDFNGSFYDTNGEVITSDKVSLNDSKIAYLHRESDGAGLSQAAKESLSKTGTTVAGTKIALVKETSTGWLRVRNNPSLVTGQELGRVNAGEEVTVLEEKPGWVKIKSSGGLEGWASSDYLQVR